MDSRGIHAPGMAEESAGCGNRLSRNENDLTLWTWMLGLSLALSPTLIATTFVVQPVREPDRRSVLAGGHARDGEMEGKMSTFGKDLIRSLEEAVAYAQGVRMKNPVHPGAFVKSEIVDALGPSVTRAAHMPGVTRSALSAVLNGRARLKPEMTLKLEEAFGIPANTLVRMQASYEAPGKI